jgi:hypothetical protein
MHALDGRLARVYLQRCNTSNANAGVEYRWYEHIWTRDEVVRRLQRVLNEALTSGDSVNHAVFVATDTTSGQLCGLVELIKLPYPCSPGPLRPYLFNLCVRQDFRKKGTAMWTHLSKAKHAYAEAPAIQQ